MNIRPKNWILYALTGVKFSLNNLGGANWRQQVFNNYRLHLLDLLAKYGEAEDYGSWLNEMLSRHSQIYNLAGGKDGNWEDTAYKNDLVGLYQHDYKGDLRFGKIQLSPEDRYDFNLTGIKTNQNTRYNIINPPTRTSGDYSREGYNYNVDNLYSAITDDRRLLGRKGDWDENSEEFKQWLKDLNSRGWETYLDIKENGGDDYYKLRRLAPVTQLTIEQNPDQQNLNGITATHKDHYGFDWNKVREGALKILSNPNLYAVGRLAGNLINNERVYDEALKGIKPVLKLTYNTYRQVVGDEATKLAYYRRAAQGLTKAARPFTSDADKQMAYLFEAKRVGDELRALGDLADNLEIRRTSDESNQHLWANAQRATEVANANLASINLANSLKHNLLALKHSALWSSIDNFLQGIEYRKRQQLAEDLAFDDLIFSLQLQLDLLYDDRIIDAKKAYQDVLNKHKNSDGTYDLYNDEVIEAKRKFQAILNQIAIEQYKKRREFYRNRNLINFAKSGTKVTKKKKDDLLYKSTRDTVEHFRKMSKISSDALNRKTPKIEKLTLHPKGKTKKYLLGGIAPFTVYKPVALGGETTTSSQYDTSSTKSSSKKDESDTLDMIKELFKLVIGKGLPSDVNSLYVSILNFLSRAQAFGEDISTEDIASMYLSNMQKLSLIEYLKGKHDEASKAVNDNDAVNEFAVDYAGRLVGQKDGKIVYIKSLKDAEEKGVNPLTNGQLLLLRAINPELAGSIELDLIAANGVGMSKIGAFLKALLPSLGSSEKTIEGYTKKESNDIKAGLQLLKEAPDGDYKYSQYTKSQQDLAKIAINYLKGILPNNMRRVIETRAELGGLSVDSLIGSLVASNVSENSKLEFDAVTGKAAKDANGNSKSTDGDIKSNFLDLVQRDQIGIDREFLLITKDGNSKLYSLNSKYISQLPNVSEDMSLERMLGESKIGSIMDSRLGVTFGDQIIDPSNFKDIMFDLGGGATIVTLPCKYENGHKVVNFAIKDEFDDAIKEVSKTISINYSDARFVKALSKKLHEKGLDSLLSGNNLDPNMFGHFMVVSAYTTDKVKFNTDSRYIEKVRNPDKTLEERIIRGLSTNKDKNDYELDINDKWGIFELTYDDIYRGSVFIPLNNDPVSALTGWGNDDIKLDETRNLAEQYLNYLKSSKQKDSSSNNL